MNDAVIAIIVALLRGASIEAAGEANLWSHVDESLKVVAVLWLMSVACMKVAGYMSFLPPQRSGE